MKIKNHILLFVLAIPVINAIATSTTNFFPAGTLNPGTIRAAIISLFLVYFTLNYFPLKKSTIIILLALIFWGALSIFSSDPANSFYEFLKMFLSIMMFPLGYMVINNISRFKSLSRVYAFVLFFFLLDILFANYFGYGTSDYLEGSFYFGAARVNITKALIVLVFIAPALFLLETGSLKKWFIILFLIGFLVALIGIKRSVLISAIAGLVIYLYLSPYKGRFLRLSLVFVIILMSILSFYVDIFFERFYARGERVKVTEETFETEARYSEVYLVLDAWQEGNLKHKLIGSEFLNDRDFFETKRMLHTDYMIILNGSGLIGIFLWFFIYYLLIREKNKYYKFLKSNLFFRQLNTVFWMLLVTQLIMSISGTVYSLNVRSLLFLYWGAIIGTMRTEAFIKYHLVSNESQGNAK